MAHHPIEVRDRRNLPRHGMIFAEDWDAERFRLLSHAQRCVYVTLTLYAAVGKGDVWPKQATIAGVTGLSQRAVEDAVRRLSELGYVRVTREATGIRRVNVSTLVSPPKDAPT